VIAPLALSFDVACPVEHAFTTWTSSIGSWWPRDHTVTGRRDAVIVLQDGVGGRIYERTADGDEHDWGEVTVWDPPHQLGYLWHLGRDRADATEVEIRFVSHGAAATRIEIEHRGWERLGSAAEIWRERNRIGWQTLIPQYLSALGSGSDPHEPLSNRDNPMETILKNGDDS
jgi:uncharacterized protein YndB with AHSA1/START domain